MVRNRDFVPQLDSEGVFLKPLDVPPPDVDVGRLSPYERVHAHHTLASARRFAYFKPFSDLIPRDDLDFILNATYDHSYEIFPDPIDVYLQGETVGNPTWRKLRNTFETKAAMEARSNIAVVRARLLAKPVSRIRGHRDDVKLPYKLNKAHPVIVSGVKERKHPSHVKLMNSSHHSPQTNGGYSRQDSDGNFYQY